jgi:hypothetical protein
MTAPVWDESHLMCWPHTGQAYLNSLMQSDAKTFHIRGATAMPIFAFNAKAQRRGVAKQTPSKNSLRLGVFAPLR